MHAVNYLIQKSNCITEIKQTVNQTSYNRKNERNKQEKKPLVGEGPS